MDVLFQKLTGKMTLTEKMERQMIAEQERIAHYRQVEQSPELKEYLELQRIVTSKEFQQKKFNLIRTKYKNTKVYHTLQEYRSLQKNKTLQLYLEVKDSDLLKEYLEFRNSDNYVRLQSKKEVRNSLELKQMLMFEKSKGYKAYLQYKSSKTPARFLELQKLIGSEEFQEEYALWSNPKRWRTTDEYRQEMRLRQLSLSPDIIFFTKENKAKIEKLEEWETTFSDDFDWLRMSDSLWDTGFVYKNKKLPRYHSFANEQQANNKGKNVGAVDGKMKIFTKREKTIAPAWDAKLGFINKEFEYTSDIVQTADKFRQQEGLFMAKIRVVGNIHHAFWLGSEGKLPLISIFHFDGKHITVGNYTKNGFRGKVIKGISAKLYYIYSLKWTKDELIWYVNNIEVFRTAHDLPKEALYMAMSSFIDEKQRAQEGEMNIVWVKVFAHK